MKKRLERRGSKEVKITGGGSTGGTGGTSVKTDQKAGASIGYESLTNSEAKEFVKGALGGKKTFQRK